MSIHILSKFCSQISQVCLFRMQHTIFLQKSPKARPPYRQPLNFVFMLCVGHQILITASTGGWSRGNSIRTGNATSKHHTQTQTHTKPSLRATTSLQDQSPAHGATGIKNRKDQNTLLPQVKCLTMLSHTDACINTNTRYFREGGCREEERQKMTDILLNTKLLSQVIKHNVFPNKRK